MRMSVAGRWLAMSSLVLLSACGGGGGDSAPPSPSLSFSPSSYSENVQSGDVGTGSVTAVVGNPGAISGTLYVQVAGADQVFSTDWSLTEIDDTHYGVTLHSLPSLAMGHHTGQLTVTLCKDAACKSPYRGASAVLPFDVDVEPAPLHAVPLGVAQSTVHWGGSDADAVPVQVTGNGLKWTATTGASWLAIDTPAGTGAATVNVRYVSTAAFDVGSYSDTVTIASSDGQSVKIPFDLRVVPAAFELVGGTTTFTAINGEPIAAKTVSFDLDSGANSAWTLSSDMPWLSVTAAGQQTPGLANLQPDPSVGPLASGHYTAHLQLGGGNPADVTSLSFPSNLTLLAPTLSTSVASVTLGGPLGRDPSAQSLSLALNTGANAYPWTASGVPAWASTTTSGSVNQAGATVSLAPSAAASTPGSTSARVDYTATVNGDTVTTPVIVNFNLDQRRLLPSTWGVAFASSPTGTFTSRTIQVAANFGPALSWTASSDKAWLSVTGSGNTGGTSSLTLAADPSQVADGSVSVANVTIATPTAGVSPAVVRVGLWKSSAGAVSTRLVGVNAVRLVADKIRPYVYAHDGGTSITVYNAYTGTAVTTIANVGTSLGAMAVSPDGSLLYAADTAAQVVRVIDLATMSRTSDWLFARQSSDVASMVAIRPNGVEVLLLGDGTAYTAGRAILPFPGVFGWGNMSATDDGRKVYTIDNGGSPANQSVWSIDWSEVAGGTLFASRVDAPFFVGNESNGADIAVAGDGSAVYTASGAPYTCVALAPGDLSFVKYFPGGSFPYPNNVEVTRDGRVACGISSNNDPWDILLYTPTATYPVTYKVANYNGALRRAQMAVTADGFVIVAPTDDPLLAFVPIGP